MQTMKCFLCLLLLPAFAFGGIWPDNFGAYHRTAVQPVEVSDRPLWDEYGFQQAEQAEYELGARKFTASAYRLQDSTGALAAFECQRPADAKPSKLAKLAVETPGSLMLAHGNYVLLFKGYKPNVGEIDALYQTRLYGASPDDNAWSLVRRLLEWLEEGWRLKDSGIWEVRGPARHFTHSKVMAWVAFDRAVRSHELGRDGPVERWRELCEEIHAEVLARAWSPAKRAFAQSYDSDELDASVLCMPNVGFLPATDERFVSTVAAIRRELTVDGLVLRYRSHDLGVVDGLPGGEGVFLPCSFWLADALAQQGRLDEARELFERLLDLRNDVGLLSEEYDPEAGRLLGNFPQAFTHLALINTALTLSTGRSLRRLAARA